MSEPVKKKVIKRKIVVKKVKKIRGYVEETADDVDGKNANAVEHSSGDESVDKEVKRRKTLQNTNMLERFAERQSGCFVEADIQPAREVPLIGDDIKNKLKQRRESIAAKQQQPENGDFLTRTDSATPPPPTSPVPSTPVQQNSFGSPFGSFDNGMVSFNDDDAPSVPKKRMPMWCTREYVHPNRYIRLHDECVDLVKYLQPTYEEEVMRKKVVLEISEIASELFPGSQLLSFGSVVTGLLLPTSDVDMTIMYKSIDNDDEKLHQAMDKLANYVAAKGLCEDAYPQVIKQTKVPIVKFMHKETWIDVDISFNSPNGRVNSELVVRYCKRLPIVSPLVLLIKYFLQQRSMHEPFTGGLGSYAVSLMVIQFVQQHPVFHEGCHPAQAGTGGLLMDFFRFYGTMFDFQGIGICVERGIYFRKNRQEMNDRATFLLQDPQNRANNVASSSRQLTTIKSAFHHAFLALSSDSFPYVSESEKSAEHPSISHRPTLLSRVIHIDHAMLDRREKVAQAYEKWVTANPTKSSRDYLRRFEDEQISGAAMKQFLRDLLEENGVTPDADDENDEDEIYVL
eukprot:TRINITY_DN12234_c0_g2_i1.p1 TRINITY_DN12234_c0_g2~~TRINITY_DN12234_c0_g2_i1.p1  ORF type:complete len:583 (+),score=149.62 TRINITY_DN12234_c0_g2_i1:44-1750(+)